MVLEYEPLPLPWKERAVTTMPCPVAERYSSVTARIGPNGERDGERFVGWVDIAVEAPNLIPRAVQYVSGRNEAEAKVNAERASGLLLAALGLERPGE